jgi:signal transduction histidine kinase
MRDRPLWLRLGLSFGGVSLAIVALTLGGITIVAGSLQAREACRSALQTAATLAASGLFETPPPEPLIRLRQVGGARLGGERIALLLSDGSLYTGGASVAIPPDAASGRSGCRIGSFIDPEAHPGRPRRGPELAVAVAELGAGGFAAAIVVTKPVPGAASILGPGIPIAVGIAVASFGLGGLVARRITRPIDRLRDAAERIGRGDLGAKVTEPAPGELGVLGEDFNRMSDALVEARRREHEFLANVSHELRTPITSVLGFAEALQDGTVSDPAGVARVARIVHAEATRLHRFADDVLTIARIGAGMFPIDPVDADARTILEQVVAANGPASEAAGITLALEVPGDLPVRTDPVRLAQVLTNLVTNAIRVSDEGRRVTLSGGADAERTWLTVRDEGPGIAPADLPHVFERAYLFRTHRDDRATEHGLGLAIVRELCARLNVTIAVSSTLGSGTTFKLTIPHA